MTVLPAIEARLLWTQRHMAGLRKLLDEYEQMPPYTVSTEVDEDAQTRVIRATLTVPPPVEISLALGDVAHQLRAVLDNAVGAMSDAGPTRRSAFVITRDPRKFDEACEDGRLTGLPSGVLAFVRSVQPFPGAGTFGERVGDGLERLDELAQHDRHRAILLRGAVVRAEGVEVMQPVEAVQPPESLGITWTGQAEVRIPVNVTALPFFRVHVFVAEEDARIRGWEVDGLVQLVTQSVVAVAQGMAAATASDPP